MTARLSTGGFAATLLLVAALAGPALARPGDRLDATPVTVDAVTADQIAQTGLALDVVNVLNAVRTNPQGASQAYGDHRPGIRGLSRTDFQETVQFLDGVSAVPPLQFNPALTDVAVIHARDIGVNGLTSHTGSDGSTIGVRFNRRGVTTMLKGEELSFGQMSPTDVILQLLADTGVPGKPHRNDLLNPVFTQVGVGCARHKQHGEVCVIELSGAVIGGPTALFVTPGTTPVSCPPEQEPTTPDRFRTDYFLDRDPFASSFMLDLFAGRGFGSRPPQMQRELTRANETAYLAISNPAALGLDASLTLPFDVGYCAPRPPRFDDMLLYTNYGSRPPPPDDETVEASGIQAEYDRFLGNTAPWGLSPNTVLNTSPFNWALSDGMVAQMVLRESQLAWLADPPDPPGSGTGGWTNLTGLIDAVEAGDSPAFPGPTFDFDPAPYTPPDGDVLLDDPM